MEKVIDALDEQDKKDRFPKSDPAGTYAEFKIRDAMGNPLRRPGEDWEGARTRIAADPAWTAWLAQQRADVEEWIAHRQDHVEWRAGWFHDFVSPKDGSFLTWTPEEPGQETLHSPSDPKVALTPKLHAAWVYSFRVKHGIKMAEAARLFRLTGEKRYADWAAGQLDFYADHFEEWPLQRRNSGIWKSVSRLFFQSLDEATNLTRHAEAARLVWDTVAPERRERWGARLFRPQAEMLEETFQSIHNIACWQRSAVGHVALLLNDAELWHKAVDAPFGIRRQLAEGVTSDYIWYEQSLLYNDYVVQALLPFFLVAGLAGRGEELRQEMLIAENLMVLPLALRFPNGDLPTPADGQRRTAPNRKLFADAYRIFPTTIGQEERERSPNWPALIDPSPVTGASSKTQVVLPPPRSHSLESSRMALLCKDGWQVYFHYGQLLQSHAQAEALQYEVWKGNTDLSHDSGTVGYGSPLYREFYTRGLAHNVPLVSGEGQSGWAPGELLEWNPKKGAVAARQPQYRPGVQASRALRVEEERLVDMVILEFTDAALPDAPLGLTLHTQGKAALPANFTPVADFTTGRPAGFRHWKNPVQCEPTELLSLLIHYPDHAFRLTLRASVPCRIFHAVTPDVPPEQRESLYLETATPCRKVAFTTVWEMARP